MDFREQILRIKQKLEVVRFNCLSPNPKSIGATYWFYEGNEPVDLSLINEFELRHQIRLPEEYRAFLIAMGQPNRSGISRIIGPSYGLNSGYLLDEISEGTHWLNRSCHFFPEMTFDDFLNLRKTLGEDDYFQSRGSLDMPFELFQGTLNIADTGCAGVIAIVIAGPYRGKLFTVNEQFELDIDMPEFYQDSNFLDWYERWLDCCLTDKKFEHHFT